MVIFNSYVKLPEGIDTWLVVWHIFYFPFHIWDVILPIDELIFFRGVGQPPTRYLWHMVSILSSFHFWFVIVISKKFVWPWQDRAMRLAHSLGLPLGTSLKQRKKPGVSESRGQSQTFSMGYIGRCSKVADFSSHGLKSCRTGGLPSSLMPESVCFPKGLGDFAAHLLNQPILGIFWYTLDP